MDVGKLFKLPELSSGSISKRKWKQPRPDDPSSSTSVHDQGGPSEQPGSRPHKAARVDDEADEQGLDAEGQVEETHFFSDDDQEDGRFFGGGLTAEQKQILDIMDADNTTAFTSTDPTAVNDLPALRKQLVRFERAINKNAEMRVKHANDPTRFIDSEADLDAELKSLLVLTTQPVLFYPEFVKLGGAASLVALLSHENADIAAAAIEVVEELTDDDVLDQAYAALEGENEDAEASKALSAMNELVDALLQHSLLDLLVSNLARFNDHLDPNLAEEQATTKAVQVEADAQAIYHALGAVENLISSRTTLAEQLVSSTPFLSWVLTRLAAKRPVDPNTNYAAELLAILLQSSDANRAKLGATSSAGEDGENGIDVLLGVVARYRRQAPQAAEEHEFVENIFDALCLSLFESANKRLFLQGEGVELMVLLMKEKKSFGRVRAVKVLDHASSGASASQACQRIVEAKALSPLFAIFMECNSSKRARAATLQTAEHVLGIFASLFTHLASDSMPRIRVLAKFVSDSFMRCDHLLDLRDTLVARLDTLALPEHQDDPDQRYLAKLEHGLFSLQLLDTLLAWLVMEDDACQHHVRLMLKRRGLRFKDVATTLSEYRDNVGDQVAIEADSEGGQEMKTSDILDALIAYLESL